MKPKYLYINCTYITGAGYNKEYRKYFEINIDYDYTINLFTVLIDLITEEFGEFIYGNLRLYNLRITDKKPKNENNIIKLIGEDE